MRWAKTLRRPALLWAIGIGLALILGGVVLLIVYESSHEMALKLGGLFATELGFALLIAAIIFVVLEEEATREHSRSVVGYLYNVDPDGRFFRKIEEYILKRTAYRGKTVVTYDFLEKHGEAVLIEYTVEYTVKNVSRECQNFEVSGSVDKKPIQAGPAPWDDRLGVDRVEIDYDEVKKEDITVTKGTSSDHCQLYKVRPIRLEPGKEARVKAVHFLEKHDHDSEVWQSSIPCESAELRLTWSEAFGLKVATEAIHPEPGALKKVLSSNSLKATLCEPLMAHHGIHFWWSSAPAGAGDSSAAIAGGPPMAPEDPPKIPAEGS